MAEGLSVTILYFVTKTAVEKGNIKLSINLKLQ